MENQEFNLQDDKGVPDAILDVEENQNDINQNILGMEKLFEKYNAQMFQEQNFGVKDQIWNNYISDVKEFYKSRFNNLREDKQQQFREEYPNQQAINKYIYSQALQYPIKQLFWSTKNLVDQEILNKFYQALPENMQESEKKQKKKEMFSKLRKWQNQIFVQGDKIGQMELKDYPLFQEIGTVNREYFSKLLKQSNNLQDLNIIKDLRLSSYLTTRKLFSKIPEQKLNDLVKQALNIDPQEYKNQYQVFWDIHKEIQEVSNDILSKWNIDEYNTKSQNYKKYTLQDYINERGKLAFPGQEVKISSINDLEQYLNTDPNFVPTLKNFQQFEDNPQQQQEFLYKTMNKLSNQQIDKFINQFKVHPLRIRVPDFSIQDYESFNKNKQILTEQVKKFPERFQNILESVYGLFEGKSTTTNMYKKFFNYDEDTQQVNLSQDEFITKVTQVLASQTPSFNETFHMQKSAASFIDIISSGNAKRQRFTHVGLDDKGQPITTEKQRREFEQKEMENKNILQELYNLRKLSRHEFTSQDGQQKIQEQIYKVMDMYAKQKGKPAYYEQLKKQANQQPMDIDLQQNLVLQSDALDLYQGNDYQMQMDYQFDEQPEAVIQQIPQQVFLQDTTGQAERYQIMQQNNLIRDHVIQIADQIKQYQGMYQNLQDLQGKLDKLDKSTLKNEGILQRFQEDSSSNQRVQLEQIQKIKQDSASEYTIMKQTLQQLKNNLKDDFGNIGQQVNLIKDSIKNESIKDQFRQFQGSIEKLQKEQITGQKTQANNQQQIFKNIQDNMINITNLLNKNDDQLVGKVQNMFQDSSAQIVEEIKQTDKIQSDKIEQMHKEVFESINKLKEEREQIQKEKEEQDQKRQDELKRYIQDTGITLQDGIKKYKPRYEKELAQINNIMRQSKQQKSRFDKLKVTSDEHVSLVGLVSADLKNLKNRSKEFIKSTRDEINYIYTNANFAPGREQKLISEQYFENKLDNMKNFIEQSHKDIQKKELFIDILTNPNIAIGKMQDLSLDLNTVKRQADELIQLKDKIYKSKGQDNDKLQDQMDDYFIKYSKLLQNVFQKTNLFMHEQFRSEEIIGEAFKDQIQKDIKSGLVQKDIGEQFQKTIVNYNQQQQMQGKDLVYQDYQNILRGQSDELVDRQLNGLKKQGVNLEKISATSKLIGQLIQLGNFQQPKKNVVLKEASTGQDDEESKEVVDLSKLDKKDQLRTFENYNNIKTTEMFKVYVQNILDDDNLQFYNKMEKMIKEAGLKSSQDIIEKQSYKFMSMLKDEVLYKYRDKLESNIFNAYQNMNPAVLMGLLIKDKEYGDIKLNQQYEKLYLDPKKILYGDKNNIRNDFQEQFPKIYDEIIDDINGIQRDDMIDELRRAEQANIKQDFIKNSLYGLSESIKGASNMGFLKVLQDKRKEKQEQFQKHPAYQGQLFDQKLIEEQIEKMFEDSKTLELGLSGTKYTAFLADSLSYANIALQNGDIPSQQTLSVLRAIPAGIQQIVDSFYNNPQYYKDKLKDLLIREKGFPDDERGQQMLKDEVDEWYSDVQKKGVKSLEQLRDVSINRLGQVIKGISEVIKFKDEEFLKLEELEQDQFVKLKDAEEERAQLKKEAIQKRLNDFKIQDEDRRRQIDQQEKQRERDIAIQEKNSQMFGGLGFQGKSSAAQFIEHLQKGQGNLMKSKNMGSGILDNVKKTDKLNKLSGQAGTGTQLTQINQEGFDKIKKGFTQKQKDLIKSLVYNKDKKQLMKKNADTGELYEIDPEEKAFIADTFSELFNYISDNFLSSLISSKKAQLKSDFTHIIFSEEEQSKTLLDTVNKLLKSVEQQKLTQDEFDREVEAVHNVAQDKKKNKEKDKKEKQKDKPDKQDEEMNN